MEDRYMRKSATLVFGAVFLCGLLSLSPYVVVPEAAAEELNLSALIRQQDERAMIALSGLS